MISYAAPRKRRVAVEARPRGRDDRVDPEAVEFGPDAEDPLGDRDEVPCGGAGQPGVLRLPVGGRVPAGDHLRVDVRLAAVHLADRLAGRGVDPPVVVERGVAVTGHRRTDHDPGVGVAEDARVLLVPRRVAGDLAELDVIGGECRLEQHDPVRGGEPLPNASQRLLSKRGGTKVSLRTLFF